MKMTRLMMLHRKTLFLVALALYVATSAPRLAAQARVVYLTKASPNLAEWKIVASEAGGPVGTSPMPPSYVPITLHLTDCAVRDAGIYFSVEIDNNRKSEVQVPVSVNSKLFDRRGTIAFRELLIHLGTATNVEDVSTFKNDPNLTTITLFGDPSVPGTISVLAPGERLLLRLKSEAQAKNQDLSSLRVNSGAFDVMLSPSGDGYKKRETWIPALFAISESTCCKSKHEAKSADVIR